MQGGLVCMAVTTMGSFSIYHLILTISVGSPRVSKGPVLNQALPDGRASDTANDK